MLYRRYILRFSSLQIRTTVKSNITIAGVWKGKLHTPFLLSQINQPAINMTIYQQGLTIKLYSLECTEQYDEINNKVAVFYNGEFLCRQDDIGCLLGSEDISEENKTVQ